MGDRRLGGRRRCEISRVCPKLCLNGHNLTGETCLLWGGRSAAVAVPGIGVIARSLANMQNHRADTTVHRSAAASRPVDVVGVSATPRSPSGSAAGSVVLGVVCGQSGRCVSCQQIVSPSTFTLSGMHNDEVSYADGQFAIGHYPVGSKLAAVQGEDGERLAHLMLHRQDLTFALECCLTLSNDSTLTSVVRQALWRSAIVAWAKCFSKSHAGRFQLERDKIYPTGVAHDVYDFFRKLRNKHIAHDENPFAQAHPGAVIAPPGSDRKVLQVLCFTMLLDTESGGTDLENLGLLVETALNWVTTEYDVLCARVAEALETRDYAELDAMPGMTINPPKAGDVGTRRTAR